MRKIRKRVKVDGFVIIRGSEVSTGRSSTLAGTRRLGFPNKTHWLEKKLEYQMDLSYKMPVLRSTI
jgi:hypothetical protein